MLPPTDYFPQDEFQKSVNVTYDLSHWTTNQGHRVRGRALLLLMRYSGLRLNDAVTLEWARLTGNRLFLYQQKTGLPVYIPLPPHLVELLRELPNSNSRYFFWTGNGLHYCASNCWHASLQQLFKWAELDKRAHPHILRDTFAVLRKLTPHLQSHPLIQPSKHGSAIIPARRRDTAPYPLQQEWRRANLPSARDQRWTWLCCRLASRLRLAICVFFSLCRQFLFYGFLEFLRVHSIAFGGVHENVVTGCLGALIRRIQQADFEKELAKFGLIVGGHLLGQKALRGRGILLCLYPVPLRQSRNLAVEEMIDQVVGNRQQVGLL